MPVHTTIPLVDNPVTLGHGTMNRKLHFGDVVALHSGGADVGGFLTADGLVPAALHAGFNPGFISALFELAPALSREARAKLEKRQVMVGGWWWLVVVAAFICRGFVAVGFVVLLWLTASQDSASSEEIALLKENVVFEEADNARELARSRGLPIHYGDSVELVHVASRGVLGVTREGAEDERWCLRIEVILMSAHFRSECGDFLNACLLF